MPRNPFYSNNVHREYPLVAVGNDKHRMLLADAEVYVRARTGYRHSQHSVNMSAVLPIDVERAEALGRPDAIAVVLLYITTGNTVQQGISLFSGIKFAKQPILSYVSTDVADWLNKVNLDIHQPGTRDMWGHLVEGTADLSSVISTAGLRMMPSRVIVSRHAIQSLGKTTVVNTLGEVSKPPPGCGHVADPDATDGEKEVVGCEDLEGPIRITGGIQTAVSQDTNQNSIIFAADGGAGELCGAAGEASQYQRESAYTTSCDDVLRTINGQQGPTLDFQQGAGTSVEPHPELNRVVIRIGSADLEICASYGNDTDTEYLPTNDDGIPCGFGGQPAPRATVPDGTTGFLGEKTIPTIPTTDVPQTCQWQWDGALWVPQSSGCSSPAYCNYPSADGTVLNQIRSTPCLYPTADVNMPVVNGDFEDDYPLNGWDSSAGAVLLVNQQMAPFLSAAQLPMVELPASGFLEQLNIPAGAHEYVLQFEAQLEDASQGSLQVVLSSMDDQTTYIDQTVTGVSSVTEYVFGPHLLNGEMVKLRFENTGTDKARFRFVSLIKQ